MMRSNRSLRGSQPPSPSGSEDDPDQDGAAKSPLRPDSPALRVEGFEDTPSRGRKMAAVGGERGKEREDAMDEGA